MISPSILLVSGKYRYDDPTRSRQNSVPCKTAEKVYDRDRWNLGEVSRVQTGLYKGSSGVVPVLLSGRGRPGLLFTAVIVVTTVPQGITVRSISTFFLAAGVGGCQDLTSLGSRKVIFEKKSTLLFL